MILVKYSTIGWQMAIDIDLVLLGNERAMEPVEPGGNPQRN
jgi:hypothetical protein